MKHLIRMSNALLALALTVISCSDDFEPKQDNKPYEAEKETLTVTAVQGSGNRPETRITYTPEGTESGGAKLTTAWEENGEQIAILGYTNDIPQSQLCAFNASGTPTDDNKSLQFTGDIMASTGSNLKNTYAALYPVPADMNVSQGKVSYTLREQAQDCTAGNETKHLKTYMPMQDLFDATTGNIDFAYTTSVFRIVLTLPSSKAVTSILLSTDANVFATGVDITFPQGSREASITPTVATNLTGLTMNNSTASTSITAYLSALLSSSDALQNKTVTITAQCADGSIYTGPINMPHDANITAGNCYTFKKTFTSELSFPAGAGTAESPYEVSSAEGLLLVANQTNSGSGHNTRHYKLTADIDLSTVCGPGMNWTPIGNYNKRFNGVFDGNGKTISNLYINSHRQHEGLFGQVGSSSSSSVVKDLHVEGHVQTDYSVQGKGNAVGGICASNGGVIAGCSFRGSVVAASGQGGTGVAFTCIGGIVGSNNLTVVGCYNEASVTATGQGKETIVGGITGATSSGHRMLACYNTGDITVGGHAQVQGIAGGGYQCTACFNIGKIVKDGVEITEKIGGSYNVWLSSTTRFSESTDEYHNYVTDNIFELNMLVSVLNEGIEQRQTDGYLTSKDYYYVQGNPIDTAHPILVKKSSGSIGDVNDGGSFGE